MTTVSTPVDVESLVTAAHTTGTACAHGLTATVDAQRPSPSRLCATSGDPAHRKSTSNGSGGRSGRPDASAPVTTFSSVKAVLCIDLEPDVRTPDPGATVDWVGAERLLENDEWLRSRLGGQVLNWFLRLDHQVEHLHGNIGWAAERFADELQGLIVNGDEIGAHPHHWRWSGERWVPDGATSWVVENAARSLEAYSSIFGAGPPSFRYGDRFVSDDVIRLLSDHPDVLVDLTTEPGASACRGLVESEEANGITRHVDVGLARRYHPDSGAVDIPSDTGGLTMVPLTTAATAGTGSIDTLNLWRTPEEFQLMLRLRLVEEHLDHLAFAIRSDLALIPWAIENVEANLDTLSRNIADLRWVRASTLALAPDVAGDQGLGAVGSLATVVHDVIRVVHPHLPIVVPPLADTVRSIIERDDELNDRLAATAAALVDVERSLDVARSNAAALAEAVAIERRRADDLDHHLETIERTILWRLRTRLLPVLQPVARARRGLLRAWSSRSTRAS
jgi:hypothetical protein